jgi:hypothetical protein
MVDLFWLAEPVPGAPGAHAAEVIRAIGASGSRGACGLRQALASGVVPPSAGGAQETALLRLYLVNG